jgi:catechol 2,3-dioxygenase-like lactoylglutathione lyase family enzyme
MNDSRLPLAHLNLTVADVERSIAFYRQWFGFTTPPRTYPDGTVFIGNDDGFDLALHPGAAGRAARPHGAYRLPRPDRRRRAGLAGRARRRPLHHHRPPRRRDLRQPEVPPRPRRVRDRGLLGAPPGVIVTVVPTPGQCEKIMAGGSCSPDWHSKCDHGRKQHVLLRVQGVVELCEHSLHVLSQRHLTRRVR